MLYPVIPADLPNSLEHTSFVPSEIKQNSASLHLYPRNFDFTPLEKLKSLLNFWSYLRN